MCRFLTKLRILYLIVHAISIQSAHGSSDVVKANSTSAKLLFNLFGFWTTTTPKAGLLPVVAAPLKCEPYQCGIPNIVSTKIVNGSLARRNYYPWTAYITYRGLFYCGAVLINDQYVLTAAHSANIRTLSHFSVVFLDYNRQYSSKSTLAFQRKVARIIVHRDFGLASQYDNDIALIKLDKAIQLPDETIRPICLPQREDSYVGKTAITTGWGSQSEFGDFSKDLQEVEVPVWDNKDCVSMTAYSDEITDNMLCAGYPEGGRDACKGDSGGPLQMYDDRNSFNLIGLVSWGKGCGEPQSPGVYTRITKYLTWISENTKDSCAPGKTRS